MSKKPVSMRVTATNPVCGDCNKPSLPRGYDSTTQRCWYCSFPRPEHA